MYKNQEKQNRQAVRHSRENGNPVGWIPAFAGMTDNQLLLQTKNLVQKERQINILVLQHLQEIENLKSRLWAFQGFLQSV